MHELDVFIEILKLVTAIFMLLRAIAELLKLSVFKRKSQ